MNINAQNKQNLSEVYLMYETSKAQNSYDLKRVNQIHTGNFNKYSGHLLNFIRLEKNRQIYSGSGQKRSYQEERVGIAASTPNQERISDQKLQIVTEASDLCCLVPYNICRGSKSFFLSNRNLNYYNF